MKWIIIVTLIGLTPEGKTTGPVEIASDILYEHESKCRSDMKDLEYYLQSNFRSYSVRVMVAAHCRKLK